MLPGAIQSQVEKMVYMEVENKNSASNVLSSMMRELMIEIVNETLTDEKIKISGMIKFQIETTD